MAERAYHSGAAAEPDRAFRIIARACFTVAAATALATAFVIAFAATALTDAARLALVASLSLYACLSMWACLRSARLGFPIPSSLFAAAVGAMLLAGVLALTLHNGLRDPSLGVLGLVVCVVGAVASVRAGAALALLAVVELTALALLERGSAAHGPAAISLPLMFMLQCLVVAGGLAAGALTSRVVSHYLRSAAARERHARDLLRLAADLYWEQDNDFRFTHVADPRGLIDPAALAAQLGKTPWEVSEIGMSEAQFDTHRADLEAHRPFSGLLVRRRDVSGRARVHSVSGEPKFGNDGAFAGYWGVARDVTEELRAQRASVASETRYRELFERSPSPLYLHRRGVVYDANPAAARLFGFVDAGAMNGLRLVDLYGPGEAQTLLVARLERLETMKIGEGIDVTEYKTRTADGRRICVQVTAVRVDSAGGPATLSILFDITAREAAEAALRRSEAMLSHLFATSPDCITLSDLESGRHLMVNAAFCRLTGLTAEEVVGRTASELGLWHDSRDRDRLRDAMAGAGRIDEMPATIQRRAGGLASVLVSAARFAMDGRDYTVVNARDVTESERARLEHAAILERASIGIALTRDRAFVQANPRWEAIFGWSTGTLAGQPGATVWVDAADYAEIGRVAGPLLAAGEPFEIEREMRRQDGSRFWCRILGQAVDPLRPSHGGTIWIADDVTERRRLDAALAAARDAAEAASRAKSAFLANTSHEIRTPLNGLLGLARLALRDSIDAAARQRLVEQIFESARGLEGILSDILDFSKIEAGKFTLDETVFDLRELLAAVDTSYRSLAEARGLSFELAIDEELPMRVTGDPVRVRQILGNFITNAVKFTESGGVRVEAGAAASGGVRLAVVDTGVGVDAEHQSHLFQPFSQGDVSTTRRFGGTGLGLSICRQLAQLMGGDVGIASEPGRGSTFWAELPLPAAFAVGDSVGTDAVDSERLSSARVLLVEDNPVNMMIAAATLAQWGVDVEEARDGRMAINAVEAAARRGRPFDLVLMDVQMPVMGGHEAAIELRKAWSAQALPIIALTAAALVSEREQALAAGMNDFLTKPIDAPKLRRTVAHHVRRGPSQLALDRMAPTPTPHSERDGPTLPGPRAAGL